MNIKIFYKFIIFCVISSCSSREDNELLGKMIGTAVGAVVGSKLGDGQNTRAIYSIIGAAGGYLIGKEEGMSVAVTTPSGTKHYEILSIEIPKS